MSGSQGPRGREGHGFPRARRLTRGREIRRVFRRGKRSRTAHLDVFDSPSPVARPRIGLVVPRYKRSAVERNRVKRRLREIARQELLPRLSRVGGGRDVLIRVRREAYGTSYQELRDELAEWVQERWSRGC